MPSNELNEREGEIGSLIEPKIELARRLDASKTLEALLKQISNWVIGLVNSYRFKTGLPLKYSLNVDFTSESEARLELILKVEM